MNRNTYKKPPRRKRKRPPQAPATQLERTRARRLRSWRAMGFVLLLFLFAVILRVSNLTAQSLWADEGNSVRVTERSLNLVIDAARADIHPPGYYLLLWTWVKLFGQGEGAVRSLSVVVGVALVGLIYLLGKRLFGPRAGWLAGFCAAVSPFQVQYSQEVRMYILVAFLGAAVTYAYLRWIKEMRAETSSAPVSSSARTREVLSRRTSLGKLIGKLASDRPQRLTWSVLYVIAAAAGLWVHYSFPIVLVVLNISWLVWWLGQRDRPERCRCLLWWLAMHVGIVVLYLPWLPIAWSKIVGYGGISASHSISFIVAQSLRLLSVGETVPDDAFTRWLTVGMWGLAVFGAWGSLSPAGKRIKRLSGVNTLALILLVLAPAAMMAFLTLTGRPAYRPKFFLVASPAFCLLVGSGISMLEQSSGEARTMSNSLWLLLGLAIVGVGAARSLRNYYFDPAYARSDYRAIAATIQSMEREGDAVLLNAPNQWEVFTYYYRGHASVHPLCRSRPPIEEQVTAELSEIAAQCQRVFAIYWATQESDPERIVERWLESNAFKASDAWYGDVRLAVYALPQDVAGTEMVHSLEDVRLGESIALRGYTLTPDRVRRGDILQITAFWEALQVPERRYKVFVHFVNAAGEPVSQYDGEPGDGMNLTTEWSPERGVFSDHYGVLVPLALAPGEYRLLLGMYDVSGTPRLPIHVAGSSIGDTFLLATIEIE